MKYTLVAGIAGARCPVKVSVPEATAFDLVRYAPKIGGLEQAMETMLPMLPTIKRDVLKAVLVAEESNEANLTTIERLGGRENRKLGKAEGRATESWPQWGVASRSMQVKEQRKVGPQGETSGNERIK